MAIGFTVAGAMSIMCAWAIVTLFGYLTLKKKDKSISYTLVYRTLPGHDGFHNVVIEPQRNAPIPC